MADSLNPALKMTDEELDAALEELGVDNPQGPNAEATPVEPPAPAEEPAPEETPQETPEEEPKTPAEDEKQPSRREQLRIQDLLRKYPPQEQPAPPTPAKQPDLLDLDNDLDADDELKQRLKVDREAAVKAALDTANTQNQDFAQQKASLLFHTRLEVDAPRTEAKYPVLDKSSDKFKPALANAVNSMYLNAVGYDQQSDTVQNPAIRYSDFIEALFELGDEIGTSKAEETKKAIVKQAAQTGLRPDGRASKPALNLDKLPHQMTDEELDAYLEQVIPSK